MTKTLEAQIDDLYRIRPPYGGFPTPEKDRIDDLIGALRERIGRRDKRARSIVPLERAIARRQRLLDRAPTYQEKVRIMSELGNLRERADNLIERLIRVRPTVDRGML